MEKNKKYVRKTFFVHQYEKEEEFLSRMAKEGWHFVKLHIGIPSKYEFVKGEKIDYIYQLDFVTTKEDTEDYHQLFVDAGWDEVYSWIGPGGKWYYFRKIRSQGKEERIFTDSESKYHMYEKLWKKFGLILIIALFIEINAIRSSIDMFNHIGSTPLASIISILLCCVFIFFSVMIVYFIMGITIEKNRIKKRLEQKL